MLCVILSEAFFSWGSPLWQSLQSGTSPKASTILCVCVFFPNVGVCLGHALEKKPLLECLIYINVTYNLKAMGNEWISKRFQKLEIAMKVDQ